MTRQELELKAKEFDSKLKQHPMSSEELQKVLCDFVEALRQPNVSGRSELLLAFGKFIDADCDLLGNGYIEKMVKKFESSNSH